MVDEGLGAVAGGGGEEGVRGVRGKRVRVVAEEVAEVEGWGNGLAYGYGAGCWVLVLLGVCVGLRGWIHDLSGFEVWGVELGSLEDVACGTSVVESPAMMELLILK